MSFRVPLTVAAFICSLCVIGAIPLQPECNQWIYKERKAELPSFFGHSTQGVANNDVALFFSGKDLLRRTDMNMKTELVNTNPLTSFITSKGYNHIGDIDVDPKTNMILAPIEESTYTRPGVFVFNTTNLQYTGEMFTLPQKHNPWVAVDNTKRVMFSSEFDNVTSVYRYLADQNMKPDGVLSLHMPQGMSARGLQHVQGGVVRGSTLLLSTDIGVNKDENGKLVDMFEFDTTSGKLMQSWEAKIRFAEMEGITIDVNNNLLVTCNEALLSYIYEYHQ